MAREVRTCRFEDWEGNIYRFEGTGGAGGATGTVISPTENINNIETDGTVIEDPESSGSAIIVSSGTEAKNVATMYIDDLIFGDYSVTLRLKSSNNSTTNTLLQIRTYYSLEGANDILLSTTNVAGTVFAAANAYQQLNFITKFKGVANVNMRMKVVITALPNTNTTFCFDYVAVVMASGSMLNTVTVLS